MLEVFNLEKKYDGFEAVKGISFKVMPGEILGYLGPNGAGKTTTIKCCCGLLKPNSGEIKIFGKNIINEPVEAKKRLGYVPQEPYLYDKLTGREYLELINSVYLPKLCCKDRNERINSILLEMKLFDRSDDLIGTYSLGMKKKIAIAAAFLHEPEVIMLDEPTAGLDAMSAIKIKDMIRSQANKGSAVLFSTHILEVAEKICDRVAIINDGKLIAIGTMEELKGLSGNNDIDLEKIFFELSSNNEVKDEVKKDV